ncbi:MAG: 3-dehydroquinate synthase [Candidatus Eremiobacteraeota bacterium]|nr:3-dehydroquinate synthase [Candidatus Eremiobacteraeota bacterium]MBV9700600.1 3-dehydroquinate synthase [Candidatus Eremiobacteraeota bacterium]
MSGTETNYDLGYPIVVGAASEFAEFASQFDRPALVLTDADPTVRRIARAAARAMHRAPVIPVPLGERRKRLVTVERVLDELAARGVERDALVVGVGGGVASDLFGFACATYMRGIRYAHVATTLVAMVDAAIGAKTGVNLRAGKNLVGSFHDPAGVFCDVTALRTLTRSAMREGMSEIVKAAIIEGGDFFASLEELSGHRFAAWPWEQVIAGAVKVKTMVVADDRLEAGRRETLNLGHTFAHGIERASDFKVPHGSAVALGLRAAGLLALQTGRFSRDEHLRVLTLLALFGLPFDTAVEPNEILAAMRHDKKRRGGRLRFTLPRAIGDVEYGVEVPLTSVRAVLRRLRELPEPLLARR